MGLTYLATFALEYGVWLWIPFLLAGILWHRRRSTLLVPLVFAAVVLPHAAYVASVGGDHFEYRPLDLYFPFAFLLIGSGAQYMARDRSARRWAIAGLAVVVLALVELPYRAQRDFPEAYAPGFPGMLVDQPIVDLERWPLVDEAERFLDPERGWLHRLPGLNVVARLHRDLVRKTTSHFVGIRREEHARFLARAAAQADALAAAIAEGRLPPDTYVALDCVGVIPFRTGLRTLDRLGLTDATVAHDEFQMPEIMAHGKYATSDYARERRVDLWATDAVRLLWEKDDPVFLELVLHSHVDGRADRVLSFGDGRFIVAALPNGIEQARARFPSLQIGRVEDPETMRKVAEVALPPFLERLGPNEDQPEARVAAGLALYLLGDREQAEAHYRAALELDPHHAPANTNLAVLLVADGRLEEAEPHLREAALAAPDEAERHADLGQVLLALYDLEGANAAFVRALELDGTSVEARRGLMTVEALVRGGGPD
jgi:hypothetical protein